MKDLIDKLWRNSNLDRKEYANLIEGMTEEDREYIQSKSREVRERYYGKDVYLRGLIEYSNYCVKNCIYCGIRRENLKTARYRLDKSEILKLVEKGYRSGYRTFVIQGGEDRGYSTEKMSSTVYKIKSDYGDVAITLSLGEKSYREYKLLYESGADRYLLRHETASERLYRKFHPDSSFRERRRCLDDLKTIGYEVGSGFMVGLPGQTADDLAKDIEYIKMLSPQMVGIGPFLPQSDTPLRGQNPGKLELVLDMVSITRLSLPESLIPATTALGSVDLEGREKGIMAGANVLMPNLNEPEHKSKYLLYDGKICLDENSDLCGECLRKRVEKTGYRINNCIGSAYGWRR
jgi:biotin synthase